MTQHAGCIMRSMIAVWDLKSQFEKYRGQDVHDCMVVEFLLNEGRMLHSKDEVLKANKVKTLEQLAQKQLEKFKERPKLWSLFAEVEMPFIKVLWQMEQNGIRLDVDRLEQLGKELDLNIEKLGVNLKKEMGEDINLNSAIQVGNFLAEKVGVPLSKTKTGRFATNEGEMAKFALSFPIVGQLLEYRGLAKLRSTYVDSLISKVGEDGRVHTTYSQVAVNTGRLASFNPNLQNIPVTSEYGVKIKSCFVADTDKTLISFDYSQQELRVLAHLSGEDTLIKAFQDGRDVHTITASQLFGVSYGDVTKEQRMIGKTINFGIIYGMSSYGMSQGLTIPVEDAQKFIDAFYKTYPKIHAFYEEYIKNGKINSYVETLLGRRRYVYEFPDKKFVDNSMRRVLMNYPIQGSAADLMRKAMVMIQEDILDQDPSIKLLLQIHDDLVFEVPDPSTSSGQDHFKTREFIERIKRIMCDIYPLAVPVVVDAKVGKRWGEMKKL